MLEVHRFGSLGFRSGRALPTCTFKRAYLDPKDGLQVYTNKPLTRYEPILDFIEFKDVLTRNFYLTKRGRLPPEACRSVAGLPTPDEGPASAFN